MDNSHKILEATIANYDHCADLLRADEVIGVPTETVYGLAGNALNESSVRKIFDVKGRPLIDPLIVHFSNIDSAEAHIAVNQSARKLAAAFWPGPLTMVVPKRATIPDLVTAGLSSVAIRVPQHPVFREILKRLDFPLAAPSANPFGYVSPTQASHVAHTLGNRIEAVLDGGPSNFGLESTIIDLRASEAPAILRHGPITEDQISKTLGIPLSTHIETTADDTSAQTAPGMLTQHYSPSAKVTLLEHGAINSNLADKTSALICNQKPEWYSKQCNVFWLSESGNLNEIAHNLFALIQRLDQQNYKHLWIELTLESGIGQAINDRLRRAAAKIT